ncbi:MAG: hypothetical protein WDN69_23075, partial [Aliidongia sp.]
MPERLRRSPKKRCRLQKPGQGELTEMLLAGDQAALGAAMAEAAEAAGLSARSALIQHHNQVNQFARRILEGMGLEQLDRDIAALAGTAPETAQALQGRRAALSEQVRALVDRNLVLFSRGETEQLREEALRNARLTALDRAQSGADARHRARDGEAAARPLR